MKATALDLCAYYGVDRRTISKWLCASPPVPSRLEKKIRVFDTVEVFAWFTERAVRRAISGRDRATPPTEARLRGDLARTKLIELELAVREGKLISLEAHKDAAGEIGNRIRAVLINIPSKYAHRLEQSGVSATDAERALIELAEDITVELRGVADDMLREVRADDRARE